MRKRVILAFMLVFALVAASSCSLIIKDEEVDKQTPIIEVVGKTFTKAEVNEQVEAVMDYEEYMYSMYGISYDRTDASTISMAQDSAIDAMVQQAVLEKKEQPVPVYPADPESVAQRARDNYRSMVTSDHDEMLKTALREMRKQLYFEPIGQGLLPENFTTEEVTKLYESAIGHKIDKQHLCEGLAEYGLIETSCDDADRGCMLFRFNKEKYEELSHNGCLLDFIRPLTR